jgi:hypothetical protein
MTGLPGGSAVVIAVSIGAFMVLGSVLEGIPAIVLVGPLLFPIAPAVGLHEVHHAMIIILAMGIGLFAPPFGVGYYAACAIGRVDPAEGIRPIWGYLLALLVGLIVVAMFPWIPVTGLEWEESDEWEAKPIQYWTGQDARQLRCLDTSELSCAHRRRLSRSHQRRLRRPRFHLVGHLCALPTICFLPRRSKHH